MVSGVEVTMFLLREGLCYDRDKGVCDGDSSQWTGEDKSSPQSCFRIRWLLQFPKERNIKMGGN